MSDSLGGSVDLEQLLDEARGSLRRTLLGELALGSIAIVLLALALGTAGLLLGLDERICAGLALAIATGGLVACLVRVILRWRRDAASGLAVARWLDRQAQSVGREGAVALLDAAEIHRDAGMHGESPALGRAAVDRATRFAGEHDLPGQVARDGGRRLGRLGAAVFGLAALNAGLAFYDREAYGRVASAFTSEGLEAVLVPTAPEPRLGDIRITYAYPEYTKRRNRTVVSASGKIRAVPGTQVTIETSTRRALQAGVVVISHGAEGDEDSQRIAVDVTGRRLRARFVITRAGRYRFELVDEGGERLLERRGHDIVLETDDPPTVRLLAPQESPLEVNERDRVRLAFKATDDFELGPARIAWRVLGTTREGVLPLTSETVGRKRFSGRGRFDLRKLKLKPGDRVAYSVEVLDNDTVGGPKVGSSETKELRVYSKKAHHARVMTLEREALDGLVNFLGDQLEKPLPREEGEGALESSLDLSNGFIETASEVSEKLNAAAKAMEDDPLGRENLDEAFRAAGNEVTKRSGRLQRAMKSARSLLSRPRTPRAPSLRTLSYQQGRFVDTLERQAVYLSDLIDDQRMIDAESLAKDLREQQQALREALEAYKKAPTPEARERIARAIEDIQKRLREITSELAQLSTQIPQDFVNADALEDRTEDLQSLEQRIEEGDLEGAMRDLDRMLGQTERMLSQLQEGREELQTREYSEITQRAEKVWNALQDVEERQRDLAERTQDIADEVQERGRERLGNSQQFVEEQISRLEEARSALEPVRPERHMPDADLFNLAERRLDDGRDALRNQDFGAAREVLEKAVEQFKEIDRDAARRGEQAERFGDVFGLAERAEKTRKALRKASPKVEEVLDAIEKLAPDPSELLEPEEKQQLERYAQEQRALGEKAEEIRKELEALGEQLPIVGPEVRSALDEAQSAMGKSGQQLGGGDAPGAAGQERRAVEALERVSKQLEEMGSQSGGGQGGAGVPLPFGQPSGRDQEAERGGRGRFNRDKVEIPKPEAYQAPTEFREDILEAAKQGTVEAYREAVRRYYEELVK
ncbi:MAG: DUF4175 family protein [Myxococcota bacterium]